MMDISIVGIFLLLITLIGIIEGNKIKTVSEFPLVCRDYNMPVLITTIFATVIGGGSTLGIVEKVYQHGYIFLLPFLAMSLNRIIVGKFFVFHLILYYKDSVSLGDIFKKIYEEEGKILTGISIVSANLWTDRI